MVVGGHKTDKILSDTITSTQRLQVGGRLVTPALGYLKEKASDKHTRGGPELIACQWASIFKMDEWLWRLSHPF
jgi:hypothetical protein